MLAKQTRLGGDNADGTVMHLEGTHVGEGRHQRRIPAKPDGDTPESPEERVIEATAITQAIAHLVKGETRNEGDRALTETRRVNAPLPARRRLFDAHRAYFELVTRLDAIPRERARARHARCRHYLAILPGKTYELARIDLVPHGEVREDRRGLSPFLGHRHSVRDPRVDLGSNGRTQPPAKCQELGPQLFLIEWHGSHGSP